MAKRAALVAKIREHSGQNPIDQSRRLAARFGAQPPRGQSLLPVGIRVGQAFSVAAIPATQLEVLIVEDRPARCGVKASPGYRTERVWPESNKPGTRVSGAGLISIQTINSRSRPEGGLTANESSRIPKAPGPLPGVYGQVVEIDGGCAALAISVHLKLCLQHRTPSESKG